MTLIFPKIVWTCPLKSSNSLPISSREDLQVCKTTSELLILLLSLLFSSKMPQPQQLGGDAMVLEKCCAHNWQQELIAYLWVMNIIICNTVIIRDRYRSICTFQEYKWKYRVDTRPFRQLVQPVKGRLRQTSFPSDQYVICVDIHLGNPL